MKGRVNLAGATLAYQLDGPASSEVVMLANSLAADMRMWEPNLAALTTPYRVLRFDMRGHGQSSTPAGPYPLSLLVNDVVALLDHLELERVHFVGLSLGGVIGQQLGALHPKRLRSLVLSNTMSEQAAPQIWASRMEAVREGGISVIVDGTIARWFTPAFLQSAPGQIEWVRAMISATRAEAYVACADTLRVLSQSSILPRIAVPTLVVTGEEDSVATPAMARHLQSHIPGAQLELIQSAAHLPGIERPEEFTAALLRFLAYHRSAQ